MANKSVASSPKKAPSTKKSSPVKKAISKKAVKSVHSSSVSKKTGPMKKLAALPKKAQKVSPKKKQVAKHEPKNMWDFFQDDQKYAKL